MKTITNLTGELTETNFIEPRGVMTAVHLEPAKGCHVKALLGGAGLVFQRGKITVAFPLDVLLAEAVRHCPELVGLTAAPQRVVDASNRS